jgi:hypothetical protein
MLHYVSAEKNESVLWRSVARHGWSGMLQYGIRASVFNNEPGWAEQVELKQNFIEECFRSGLISSCRVSMVIFRSNDAELGKSTPIVVVKFMRKLRNLAML